MFIFEKLSVWQKTRVLVKEMSLLRNFQSRKNTVCAIRFKELLFQ